MVTIKGDFYVDHFWGIDNYKSIKILASRAVPKFFPYFPENLKRLKFVPKR